MKISKTIGLLLILLISSKGMSQMAPCDDFADMALFPENTFDAGELIGYSQSGTQVITCGADGWASMNEGGTFGLSGGEVNLEFDGTDQIVNFYFVFDNAYPELDVFSVNGGTEFNLAAAFPITIDGVVIDIDYGVPDVLGAEYAHLIFTGIIDVITMEEAHELWILELCSTAEPINYVGCDDFTDVANYPVDTYNAEEFIGYSQSGTQTIESGLDAFGGINNFDLGIYGVGPVNFGFDGSSQTARFLSYGLIYQFDEMGFSVNGSSLVYLDGVFPMVVGGVTIDLDLSPPNDGEWEYFYLTFTGVIDDIQHELFESAVVELCTTAEPIIYLGCDDFEDLANFPTNTYGAEELIGFTQGGTQTIETGVDAFAWTNDSQPGIYGVGPVNFELDGSSQTVRFLCYGYLGQFDQMGFSVNGSPNVYLDGAFPMTLGGIRIDLDLSPTNDGSWEYFYLTFSGDIDVIGHELFESGVTEMCVEELVIVDDAGIEHLAKSSITVYPNPATNYVSVQAESIISQLEVYTLSGQIIMNEVVGKNTIELDLSDLLPGLYLVKITEQNGTETIQKLIRQ